MKLRTADVIYKFPNYMFLLISVFLSNQTFQDDPIVFTNIPVYIQHDFEIEIWNYSTDHMESNGMCTWLD